MGMWDTLMFIFRYIEKGSRALGFSRQHACGLVAEGMQIPARDISLIASYSDDDVRKKTNASASTSTSTRGYQPGREWTREKKRYDDALNQVKTLDCGHVVAYYLSVQSVPLGAKRTANP